jgi:diguanylate cyclase (GGDEF)-like protein
MTAPHPRKTALATRLARVAAAPFLLALVPAATLLAYGLWGETGLIVTALALPLALAILQASRPDGGLAGGPRDRVTGLVQRDGFEAVLDTTRAECARTGLQSACVVIDYDDFSGFAARHGQSAADAAMARGADRLLGALRSGDTVARIGDGRFAICLMPVRRMDLELGIQLAGRLQTALEDALPLGGVTLYLSASVGLCLSHRAPGGDGAAWADAARAALAEAQSNGPSGIRAFTPDIARRRAARSDLRSDAAAALDNGQLRAWFQPQVSTDTGRVSGFEALARWTHPVQGAVPPDRFLPALAEAGLLQRLTEVMLFQALSALRDWDAAGAAVPRVSINLSQADLNDPHLTDRLIWDVDRFGLTPERLGIEVLETVLTDGPADCVARNLTRLGKAGFHIDLDDYGTGHASIAMVRRFPVRRIKIDRSFVTRADRDPEQQRLVSALLTMAERLDLGTLAEGVETVGEHALLAQLGCQHVQGYGIARPMPADQTLPWLGAHERKLARMTQIGRQSG